MTLGRDPKIDKNLRDVDADYKAAYLAEYHSYVRVGRDEDAAAVAEILRTSYDVEVAPAPVPEPEVNPVEKKTEDAEPRQKRPYNKRQGNERADLKPAPETVVPPKPEHPSED